MSQWPFEDPQNVATITVQQIANGGRPILRVLHDADDGMWQFFTDKPANMAEAMVISLREVYSIDSTISELADLPLGWMAERSAVGQPWRRSLR